MNQDDTDHAWNQAEESQRRRQDDLNDILKDIAQCHKLLDQDPEYAEWSEKLSREAQEQQDKEHDEPIR